MVDGRDKVITLNEAAEILCVSYPTVYRMVTTGRLYCLISSAMSVVLFNFCFSEPYFPWRARPPISPPMPSPPMTKNRSSILCSPPSTMAHGM